jgi:hypothetical protein
MSNFLMTWCFLHTFGAQLALSTFSLDDYESALHHSAQGGPCDLLSESHIVLLLAVGSLRDSGDLKPTERDVDSKDADTAMALDKSVNVVQRLGSTQSWWKPDFIRRNWERSVLGWVQEVGSASLPRCAMVV